MIGALGSEEYNDDVIIHWFLVFQKKILYQAQMGNNMVTDNTV